MADDRLKNFVLSLADTDYTLSEQVRLVVLAALEGSNDLAEVLGDDATSSELVESLTAVEEDGGQPVGAYLRSITVQGFRGIGAQVTLPFRPGPGLIVVAGRNGSGKSTLAEGLELALTGTNSRWNDKAAVWSQNWRNLHAGDPAHIRVDIAEEGSGATTIGVDWPAGDGIDVDDFKAWVQRDGKKREDTSVLGWAGALEMYRPLLSYDELGGILEGRPSDFYDQLHKLLGLEQLTEAMARLDAEVKHLKQPSAVLTALDFVGHQRREFRFDQRFRAMSGVGGKALQRQSRRAFRFCHRAVRSCSTLSRGISCWRTSNSRWPHDGRRWCPRCVRIRTTNSRPISMRPDAAWKMC
jgi:hypothetical protein